MYAIRTRFIPGDILDKFERSAWPRTPAAGFGVVVLRRPVDIGARVVVPKPERLRDYTEEGMLALAQDNVPVGRPYQCG